MRVGFEGGQNPLIKSLPSIRGFTNNFRREYAVVNLDRLADFPAESKVTPKSLAEAGLVRDLKMPVKVLGRGELDRPLAIEADKFSSSARSKIEAAGGSAVETG